MPRVAVCLPLSPSGTQIVGGLPNHPRNHLPSFQLTGERSVERSYMGDVHEPDVQPHSPLPSLFHWPELVHGAIPDPKGVWEIECLPGQPLSSDISAIEEEEQKHLANCGLSFPYIVRRQLLW